MGSAAGEWRRVLRAGPLLPEGAGRPADLAPQDVLPHRPPLLLLDALEAVDPSTARVRARRAIDPEDPVLRGHFPGSPIYPGVLLIETVAQAAIAAHRLCIRRAPGAVRFTRVLDAAFFAPVGPGDRLSVQAQVRDDGLLVSAAGQVWRGDTLCAYAVAEALVDEDAHG